MGRHQRQVATPVYDRYFHRRSRQEWARLPESVWDAWEAEAERTQAREETWRGLHPPPEALSPQLPYPLGVVAPRARDQAAHEDRCTQRHRATWRAAELTRKVLQWLIENETTPHELGRRHRLRATTLTDHLVGKSVMQDGAARDWKAACRGLHLRNAADPLLYCWRNKVYRWPDLPLTVPGQQANLTYPMNLEMLLVEGMYVYDERCYCRVATWLHSVRSLQRTGEPEIPGVIIGRNGRRAAGPVLDALDAFHPTYVGIVGRAQLMSRVAADPGGVVAEYLGWRKTRYPSRRPPGYGRRRDAPPNWARTL